MQIKKIQERDAYLDESDFVVLKQLEIQAGHQVTESESGLGDHLIKWPSRWPNYEF